MRFLWEFIFNQNKHNRRQWQTHKRFMWNKEHRKFSLIFIKVWGESTQIITKTNDLIAIVRECGILIAEPKQKKKLIKTLVTSRNTTVESPNTSKVWRKQLKARQCVYCIAENNVIIDSFNIVNDSFEWCHKSICRSDLNHLHSNSLFTAIHVFFPQYTHMSVYVCVSVLVSIFFNDPSRHTQQYNSSEKKEESQNKKNSQSIKIPSSLGLTLDPAQKRGYAISKTVYIYYVYSNCAASGLLLTL